MKALTSRPLTSWIVWAAGLITVLLILTWQFVLNGFVSDKSGISYVIMVLFGIGFFQSFRSASELNKEWDVLRRAKADKKIPDSDGKEGLSDMFSRIADLRAEGKQVDVDNFMTLYYARHDSTARTVSTIGSLLVTMGLLGTIVGLIVAMQGLGGIIDNMSLSRMDMLAGLRQTVQGMGIAFYTTFFGALLGGVILRILSSNLMNSLSELSAEAMEFCELYVLPCLGSKEAEMWVELANEWNRRLKTVTESFAGMVQQVDDLGARLGQSINGLVEQVNTSGKGMAQQADDLSARFGQSINGLVEQVSTSGKGMVQQADSLSASLGQSINGLAEQVSTSGKGMVQQADDLNVRLGESINGLAVQVSTSGKSMMQQADDLNARLGESISGLAEQVNTSGKSMVQQADDLNARLGQSVEGLAEQVNASGKSMVQQVDDLSARLGKSIDGLVGQVDNSGKTVHRASAHRLEAETQKVAGQLAATAEVLRLISFSSDDESQSAE